MAQIIYAPAIPILQVGGRVFTDITNLIILSGTFNGAVNGYCSARRQNGTTGYAPGAGKSFRLMAFELSVLTVTANATLQVGYQDADVGFGTNNAPTNLVQVAGSGNGTGYSTNTVGVTQYALDFSIPTGKYLYTFNSGNVSVGHYRMFGYEV